MNGFNVSISMTWDRQAGILKPTIPQRILTSRLDWNRWGRWCWCWWWWFQWIGYVGNIDTGKLHDLNGNIYGFRRLRFFLQPIHWWLWCWWVLMICMILYISSSGKHHVTESRMRRDTSQFQAVWRCWGIQWLKRSKYGTMAKDPLGAFGWRMKAILRSWRYSSI